MEKVKGRRLEFISQINRDGSGTSEIKDGYHSFMMDETFDLLRLSISEDTYIAHGFNSFVVRLKKPTKGKCYPCKKDEELISLN